MCAQAPADTYAGRRRGGYPGATVTDVASVKVRPLRMLASGADASRYAGSHPMAGMRSPGPVAARGELFQRARGLSASTIGSPRVRAPAFRGGGAGRDCDGAERSGARSYGGPHLACSAGDEPLLASRLQDTLLYALSLAGQGLRDTVRIAASTDAVGSDFCGEFRADCADDSHGVRDDLNRLISTLENPTASGARLDLAQLMSEGNVVSPASR